MWHPVLLITAPAAEPVTVADAKLHLRVDHNDDDAVITAQIAVARDHVERETGTQLITQTVEASADDWANLANLPFAPVQSVTITYVDTAGDSQTLSTNVYEARLFGLDSSIVLKSGQAWPSVQAGSLITVRAVAGYGDAGSNVPQALVHALKLILGDLYEHRGDGAGSAIPPSARALLQNYRRLWL